jgi:hypothetical protein
MLRIPGVHRLNDHCVVLGCMGYIGYRLSLLSKTAVRKNKCLVVTGILDGDVPVLGSKLQY